MTVIETQGLTKRYRKTVAVDRVSFSVERGQIFGFLGPNGSGKTTTIGMLLGITTPTAGEFRLFGERGSGDLHRIRRRVGATLEQPNFYPYLSGFDNLRIAASVKGVGRSRIHEVLDMVGLRDRRKDAFKAYSLGMKQRLALAATLLGDPELIILDEPANGLDPEGMREIRKIILELGERGKTIFLSSHLLHEVERTCTHVAVIRKGRIIRQDSVGELLSGNVLVELGSADPVALEETVRRYPATVSARREGDAVVVQLADDGLDILNRFLAEQSVFLSRLALRRRSLEDAFLEITSTRKGESGASDADDSKVRKEAAA
ncbi:MAG: ABC transporter ATP-binding protein [Longimicrobiales bacterium]